MTTTPADRLAAARSLVSDRFIDTTMCTEGQALRSADAIEALIDAKLDARDAERSPCGPPQSDIPGDPLTWTDTPGGDDGSATRKDAGTTPMVSPLPPGSFAGKLYDQLGRGVMDGPLAAALPPGTSTEPDPQVAALVAACEAVVTEFDKDSKHVLWTGEAVIVQLRACLAAYLEASHE